MAQLYTLDLGLTPYAAALAIQRRAAALRITGELSEDLLLLVQHPPVVTLGRGFKPAHLLSTPEQLADAHVELHEAERGGDITVHEPGQLVGYVIIDLKRHRQDLHWFLRQVEQGVIDGVGALGVTATRRTGLTGVWVEDRKLASIGVHARDWVTWHGFALNVENNLRTFAHTVPCGIPGVEMTSVKRETHGAGEGAEGGVGESAEAGARLIGAAAIAVAEGMARAFGLSVTPLPGEQVAKVLLASI